MLQYAELERAEIEEVGGRTSTQGGNVVHSVAEHDVRIPGGNGRCCAVGLRVTDKQQAQWVVGHLNRRIAASSPAAMNRQAWNIATSGWPQCQPATSDRRGNSTGGPCTGC
jgi:hypothetical protein